LQIAKSTEKQQLTHLQTWPNHGDLW